MLVLVMGGYGPVGRLPGGASLCFFPLEHIGMAAWKLGDSRIGGLPVAGLGHYGRTGLQRLMLQRCCGGGRVKNCWPSRCGRS